MSPIPPLPLYTWGGGELNLCAYVYCTEMGEEGATAASRANQEGFFPLMRVGGIN